ncbi:hypothetical protein [Trichococcus shcherbakoviae]|nr:hypothetical protein [Trichococcus shcherbakoviae]
MIFLAGSSEWRKLAGLSAAVAMMRFLMAIYGYLRFSGYLMV